MQNNIPTSGNDAEKYEQSRHSVYIALLIAKELGQKVFIEEMKKVYSEDEIQSIKERL